LTVRPPKGTYRIRFGCHKCQWWGDEFDMMRWEYGHDRYPQLKARMDEWRLEYGQEVAEAQTTIPPGDSGFEPEPSRGAEDWAFDMEAVDRAYGGLTDEERSVLVAARVIMQAQRVPFEELSEYCHQLEELEKVKARIRRYVDEPNYYEEFIKNGEAHERWLDEVLPGMRRDSHNGRR
jgi:hypothetical protein